MGSTVLLQTAGQQWRADYHLAFTDLLQLCTKSLHHCLLGKTLPYTLFHAVAGLLGLNKFLCRRGTHHLSERKSCAKTDFKFRFKDFRSCFPAL
jgi:hypothetical protein